MKNSKEHEEKYEEPDLDYFKAWGNPSRRSKDSYPIIRAIHPPKHDKLLKSS